MLAAEHQCLTCVRLQPQCLHSVALQKVTAIRRGSLYMFHGKREPASVRPNTCEVGCRSEHECST